MAGKERGEDGRFVQGNSGGPGRPRRAVEDEYLMVLSDAVSLGVWKDIVKRAVEDAKDGDWRARRWLSLYLLGAPRKNMLFDLAVCEGMGKSVEDKVKRGAEIESISDPIARALANMTL
jgi:hypothetical protein